VSSSGQGYDYVDRWKRLSLFNNWRTASPVPQRIDMKPFLVVVAIFTLAIGAMGCSMTQRAVVGGAVGGVTGFAVGGAIGAGVGATAGAVTGAVI
jgi:hypothetical protein